MRFARALLFLTAAVWILYGLWLFFDPKGLAYAGYGLDHWSAVVEVQAMYGGAEIALGIFTLLGALKPQRYGHSALLLWALIYSSLAIGRLVGIGEWGGTYVVEFGKLPDSYNPGSLWFLELPSALMMWTALYLTRETRSSHGVMP